MKVEDRKKIMSINVYEGDAVWTINPQGESLIIGDHHNPNTILLASLTKRLGEDLHFLKSHHSWAEARKAEIQDALKRVDDYLIGTQLNAYVEGQRKYPQC
jgi:hypothetical protein